MHSNIVLFIYSFISTSSYLSSSSYSSSSSSSSFASFSCTVVIDKDRNPKWQPKNLSEIDDDTLDDYFKHREHYADLVLQDESIKENCKEHENAITVV